MRCIQGRVIVLFDQVSSLVRKCVQQKIVAFDTFGRFPDAVFEPDISRRQEFIEEAGDKSISKDELTSLLEDLNLYENIELVEGDILETAPSYIQSNPHMKLSLLHIDVDLFEPTKACLECFYTHVVRGGIVILDDYGAFPGANKAIDGFLHGKAVVIQKLPYSHQISFVEKP